MKKLAILSLMVAICLVGCKENKVDTEIARGVQQERETLTQAEVCCLGDFNETGNTNEIALILASKNVCINFDAVTFNSFSGTGYAFNIVLHSDAENVLVPADGTYLADEDESNAPFTYDIENTYLSILNGDAASKVVLDTAAIVVASDNGQYVITIDAVTTAGAKIHAQFNGQLDSKVIYAFRESNEVSEVELTAIAASYQAEETNRSDWANDSAASYYSEMYAYYAAYYYEKATEAYQQGDSAKGDAYAKAYSNSAYYADYYAEMKEEMTPLNAHYFQLVTADGDVLDLEIDLNRLDAEYTPVIPNGTYDEEVVIGFYEINKVSEVWTDGEVYGSSLKCADGSIYYLLSAEVEVVMDGDQVQSMEVLALSMNGTMINCSYTAE